MAVIKCKMCGGDLNIIPGETVAECEYCGSRQTVPTADNEKKLTLFARANRLRAGCEFDKAAGVYESIVADFPEEAEAYWGLVLCKYGIEYVDDPATGKKIPTCHRSSFDSILEDSDFEQACENADTVARKVYREEAKQIEEIRKGIIEVSGKEQPYDIFICYRETDENGERTLDSVLAQDVYDALTDKGYRVFFSRITLEDKLGQEYEPYIFAALNSAKIMLAFGTDYEYYNAVWVKNEWSRFLKLMEKDKTKHLIPCYKGIDAYDMPREFAKLQAQDLGKVGAIQDLLRGIEKLLPKAEPAAPVEPEKIVVSNPGEGSKIASLLDRGNMALEDDDWEAADSFFEDVLNNDSKNAQAYLGKTLAQEECSSLDELVQERLEESRCVDSETLYIPERQAHVAEMVEKYTLPGYVGEVTIRELYKVDRSYSSEVSGRQKQYQEEENWWQITGGCPGRKSSPRVRWHRPSRMRSSSFLPSSMTGSGRQSRRTKRPSQRWSRRMTKFLLKQTFRQRSCIVTALPDGRMNIRVCWKGQRQRQSPAYCWNLLLPLTLLGTTRTAGI